VILFLSVQRLDNQIIRYFQNRFVFWGLATALVVSNLVFAWYMAGVFFS
jgi:hypothetical protein